jgi:hypothetical protein
MFGERLRSALGSAKDADVPSSKSTSQLAPFSATARTHARTHLRAAASRDERKGRREQAGQMTLCRCDRRQLL